MAFKAIKEALKSMLVKLESNKVYTDSELKISEKANGGKVEMIGEDGSLAPAADGDYEMEDGNKFVVKDGVIVEWNGEKAEDKPVEEAPKEESLEEDKPKEDEPAKEADWKAELDAMKADVETMKAIVEELRKSIADNASNEQAMSEQFKTQLDELNATLKVIAKVPAEFSKTNPSNIVKDSEQEKKAELKALFGLK